MTSLVSSTTSPTKDGTSSLPRRQSSFARSPLRALYDLLIAPMEGVSTTGAARLPGVRMHHLLLRAHVEVSRTPVSSDFSVSIWKLAACLDKALSFQVGRCRFKSQLCSL